MATPKRQLSRDAQSVYLSKPPPQVASMRSAMVSNKGHSTASFSKVLTTMKAKNDWLSSFTKSDPRWLIMNFFKNFVMQKELKENPSLLFLAPTRTLDHHQEIERPAAFSVWRPTSIDAIKMMMLGQGTGKGLDVKGKSAKRGDLSGYVPYVQIHNNDEHKKRVGTCPHHARISIFYKTKELRDSAVTSLKKVLEEMKSEVDKAEATITEFNKTDNNFGEDEYQESLRKLIWKMENPKIYNINRYAPLCFGVDIPERLFWEAYVVRGKCIREEGSPMDTGRKSVPQFFYMNMKCTRDEEKTPKAVVWQWRDKPDSDPMDPMTLIVAYEENNNVVPVVSDFDPFLVGTRGVEFDKSLDPYQVDMLKWCITEIEKILQKEPTLSAWTKNWLNCLKDAADKGIVHKVPKFGFGDPVSYSMIKNAVHELKKTGAVRHGAECFNYYFPQQLDETFLVIAPDKFGKKIYKEMNEEELRTFLIDQVNEGYTFPLNPKWILCDPGWIDVWYALRSSKHKNVLDSLNVWYPPESGIVEHMDNIIETFPNGLFADTENGGDNTEEMDLAMLQLNRYITLKRAKKKLRAAMLWMRLSASVKTESSENGDDTDDNSKKEAKSQAGENSDALTQKLLLEVSIKTTYLSQREKELKKKEDLALKNLESKEHEFSRKEAKFKMLEQETNIKKERLSTREKLLEEKLKIVTIKEEEVISKEKIIEVSEKKLEKLKTVTMSAEDIRLKELEVYNKEAQLKALEAELDAQSELLSALQCSLSEREEALSIKSGSSKSSRRGWLTRGRSSKKSLVNIPPIPFSEIGIRNSSLDSVASGMTQSLDPNHSAEDRPTLDQNNKKKSKKSMRLMRNLGKSVRRFSP